MGDPLGSPRVAPPFLTVGWLIFIPVLEVIPLFFNAGWPLRRGWRFRVYWNGSGRSGGAQTARTARKGGGGAVSVKA